MKQLLWGLGGALVLGACAATEPVHFHALYADEVQGIGPDAGYPLRYEVQVTVPERLNRNNIVLSGPAARKEENTAVSRSNGQGGVSDSALQVLENERWEAAFGDALQDALAAHLARATAPVAVAPMRLDVRVYRFDARLSGPVDVLLDWTLHRRDVNGRDGDGEAGKTPDSLSCRHAVRPAVAGGDVKAAVHTMQQAVAQLAADVVQSSRQWLRSGRPRCQGSTQQSLARRPAADGQHGG